MSATIRPVHYPESDSKPMESDIHRNGMVYFIEALKDRYRGREVYVSGNLLLYYVEGEPKKCVSPDCLVAFGRPAGQRRIYKTWEEGKVPDVVIEVTSSSTRREDQVTKRALYARLGVGELWLVDPLGDYLRAPFRGYRLQEGSWVEIPVQRGRGSSPSLELEFCATEDGVRLFDPITAEFLPSPEELASRLRDTSRELDRTMLRLDSTVQQLDQTAQQLDQTTQRLDVTTQQLDEVTETLRAKADENAQLRAEIERLRAALQQPPSGD
jgi:Uma2 family endonuclease